MPTNKITPAQAKRLAQAIAESLADAPAHYLDSIAERLQSIAADWSIGEVTERCEHCWRTWDECPADDGEPSCWEDGSDGEPRETSGSIETAAGTLALVESRAQLDTWSFGDCLDWVRRNDPNGEWDDDSLAEYETTADDLREAVWLMIEDN